MLKKTLLLALITTFLSAPAQAAIPDAGADLKRANDIGEYYKKEKDLYQEKTIPAQNNVINKTEADQEKTQAASVKIFVHSIISNKSEILEQAEIKAITAKYEERELELKELYNVLAEINKLYQSKSYITAKAILPPQKIEEGIVRIQLVEGHFGDFLVDGNRHTKSAYIKDRVFLKNGDLVNLDQLQKNIFYFNGTNDIGLKAELRPGKNPGTTDCILHAAEPDDWQAMLFSDNAGRGESGLYRVGMVLTNNNMFGNRESLVLSPTWTRGTKAGSVSYTIPIDKLGTKMGLSYSKNQTNIISGPYETLDIKGDSSDVGLNIVWPLVVEANRKVDGYAEVHWKDSNTDFSGTSLLNSEVNTLTVGSNIHTLDRKGMWYGQYAITNMVATKKDAYNDHEYWRFNLATVRQQEIANGRSLIWRLSGQMTSSRELPSSEQFSLGGMSSVKGYTEGIVSGDQGYYAGVEIDFPLVQDSPKLKGLAFLDHGSTYNAYVSGGHSKEFLTSMGVGVIFNYSPNLFGKVIVGLPLDSSTKDNKARIHFFLQSMIK